MEAFVMTTEEMEVLVNEYGTSLYRFCCHLTGNVPEAEDLYQDTFLKTVELSHKLDRCGDGKSKRNYLIGISVNLWKNKKPFSDSKLVYPSIFSMRGPSTT